MRLDHLDRLWKKFKESTAELNKFCEEENFLDLNKKFSDYGDVT